MQFTDNTCSFVLVGAWNPAILDPNWLVREIFESPQGVEVPVSMEFTPIPGAAPKFTIEGITFIPSGDKLILLPRDLSAESLRSVEAIALKILQTLHHTPIAGIGENIQFVENNPTPQQVEIFSLRDDLTETCDLDLELDTIALKRAFSLDNGIVNLTQIYKQGTVTFEFNFHYGADSADNAAALLSDTFYQNMMKSLTILESYEFTPENVQELTND
jgi:hypothetical protein